MTNVSQMSAEALIKEGVSQQKRLVKEVMDALYARLSPEKHDLDGEADMVLSDGTQCWIRQFVPTRDKDGYEYGFEVRFLDGPLMHLEFAVRCTGWERGVAS